ncbi:glutamate receptor-like [Macrobrachium nipponense]|uniref:glutamate receptor-like n=1 Tax=Macrobrachium nipponense TaxID=159736 RepID=UPI0030C88F5E
MKASTEAWVVFLLVSSLVGFSSSLYRKYQEEEHYLQRADEPLKPLLKATTRRDCSVIFVADKKTDPYSSYLIQELELETEAPHGISTFELMYDAEDANNSRSAMSSTLREVTKLRKASWCVVVIVLSDDPVFLTALAKVGLKARLVGWPTKMLVVTRLEPASLTYLISQHWIYSLMSTMFVNLEVKGVSYRWVIYSHFPYSPEGPKEVVIGTWAPGMGFRLHTGQRLFPDKYQDFHGGIVNVTSLTHTPYWMEEEYTKEDGTKGKIITGTDGLLLHVIAKKLNFTFYLMPADDWDEVERLVIDREAYMSPVYWDLIPERLERYDMSFVYEHAYFAFSMVAPPVKPHWTSLYYPLTDDVWIATLVSLAFASVALAMMLSLNKTKAWEKLHEAEIAILEVVGTLLNQTFAHQHPDTGSTRMLVVAWLLFSFLIGSVYRANLTAFLMLPKPQPRAETVEELVEAVDVVTGETYSESTKIFFMKSEYPPYRKLGEMLTIGYETSVGMRLAEENKRSSHVDFLKHMHHVLVDKFTRPDGTTSLYIGKSNIVYLPSSWPMSHDTPFLPHVDKILIEAVESGIIEKWYRDEIEKARRKSMERLRESRAKGLAENSEAINEEDIMSGAIPALSLAHLQGPFILVVIGSVLAFVAFFFEVACGLRCCR